MHTPDEQLVQRALAGDLDSFNLLVAKYQGTIYGLAYHLAANFADAQDITQETFLRAYERLEQLKDPGKFSVWIRQIAANACHKLHRGQPSETVSIDAPGNQKLREEIPHQAHQPDERLEAMERATSISNILSLLPEKARLATTLFYIDDLSYQQISSFLEVPVSTVRSRLHSARKRLSREALQMVEESLGHERRKLKIEIKKACGYLHVLEEGWGFLRPTAEATDSTEDIYMSAESISMFHLEQGDFVEGHARNPGHNEKYWSGLRFERINSEPAVTVALESDDERLPAHSEVIQQVKKSAREEAVRLRHSYIGTEHLLLGVLQSSDGRAVEILQSLDVDPHDFKEKVEEWVGSDPRSESPPEAVHLVPRAEGVLSATRSEARAFGAERAGSEHLLLALARDKNSVAAKTLWRAGIDYEALKGEIAR